jgi:hypothetical protein
MPEQDPLADVITLLAAPISGAVRSIEQFRTGVDEFLHGIENFNRTMENLNETAERMNVLLGEVEEPIKAAVPQITRAINNADEVMQVVSGPAMAAAPGLARMADTMNSPAFQQLPDQIATFSEVLVDLSSRMAPLTQLAETAGGLFGLRMPGAAARSGDQRSTPGASEPPPPSEEHTVVTTVRTRAVRKKTATAKSATAKPKAKAKPAKAKPAKAKPAKKTSSKTTTTKKAKAAPDPSSAEEVN